MTDKVNHPSHYQSGDSMEVIEVIEAFNLPPHLANAVKYILRAGKKRNAKEDLKKAIWYLVRHLFHKHKVVVGVTAFYEKHKKKMNIKVAEGEYIKEGD